MSGGFSAQSAPPAPSPPAARIASAAQVLAAGLLGWILWSILCVTPFEDWNSARLLPAALVGHGHTIYFLPNAGPAIGWIYGPVMPLLMAPTSWLPTPTAMVLAAAWLNAALMILPVLLSTDSLADRAGVRASPRRWLLLAAAAVLIGAPWTGSALRDVHVDTTATALGLVSCWCLAATPARPSLAWGAAVLVVLAVWTKQIEVGVPAAQLLWLGATSSARAAARYAGRLLAAGLLAAAVFGWAFGWAELWYNLIVIPSHHPMKGDWQVAAAQALQMGASCLPFILLMVVCRRRGCLGSDTAAVGLLVTVAVVEFPLGVMGGSKAGGGANSYHSIYYFGAACAWFMAVARTGPAPWIRNRAAPVVACLLAAAALSVRAHDGWNFRPSRRLALETELARTWPDQAFFPLNPLVSWWTEGRIYHLEYGYFDQVLAGYPVDAQRTTAWLPPHLRFIVYPDEPGDHPFAKLLAGYSQTFPIGGFIVHVAAKPADGKTPLQLNPLPALVR